MKTPNIPFILIILMTSVLAYTNSPITMPGFNVSSYDINLKNKSIWNGSVNGTNFAPCDTSTYASAWNGSGFECVTKGGIESDPIAEASKVNKSGDNISGRMNTTMSGTLISILDDTPATTKMFQYYEYNVTSGQNVTRSYMTIGGTQLWKLRQTHTATGGAIDVGYILYSTPGGYPGISFYNATLGQRTSFYNTATGIQLFTTSATTGIKGKYMELSGEGNLTVEILAGAGNAYTCVDSTGKLYRGSPTC